MREIEKTMIREIFSNAGQWKKSFSCRDSVECKGYNTFNYYLWENNIFSKDSTGIEFSFCGWSSQTTKNRLNAFLSSFWNEGTAPQIRQVNFNMVLKLKGKECKTDNSNFTFFKEYKIDESKRYRINFADSILREV